MEKKYMKLYWVTTEDHDEDWFIVASSSEEASKYHEDMEGYESGDAKSEEILDIPENIPDETGWPCEMNYLKVYTFILRKLRRILVARLTVTAALEVNGKVQSYGKD